MSSAIAEERNCHYALNSAGFLIIGSTEDLLGAGSELFDMVAKKQKL